MRHALIITAYKDVEMLNSIIKATPKDYGIFIHIDRKSTIRLSDINNRAKLFSWKKVYWGGWEHLYVIVELLREAIKDSRNFDYFHIITGQDFYSINPSNFDSIIGNTNSNYLDIFKLPNEEWGWGYGLNIYKYKSIASYCDIRKQPYCFIHRLYLKFQEVFLKKNMPSFPLYGGSVYCSLHSSFVSYLLNDAFAKNLFEYLKHHLCAEEIYFQTVIMNSPFSKEVVSSNLRYIDWSLKTIPKTLDENDVEKICGSKTLFARKFDLSVSKELIDALTNKLGIKESK